MHSISRSSLAASLSDSFAGRTLIIGDCPEVVSLAIDEAMGDILAWEADSDSDDLEGYAPGWDAESFEPSPADLAAMRDPRDHDGHLGDEEKSLLAHSIDEWSYRNEAASLAEAIEAGRPWL